MQNQTLISQHISANSRRVNFHSNGVPYSPAIGRFAPQQRILDKLESGRSVVHGTPSKQDFIDQVVRELKIRFYQPKSIKNYKNALRSFLNWLDKPPHRAKREDVREFLSYLVDAGLGYSTVSIHLSAIRTVFDKLCLRQITLGLSTPRRSKKLPVVLSQKEIGRLLESAPSIRDKLVLALMYATGMRVSEVVNLRFQDIDFDRQIITVRQGKGRVDRQVMLPKVIRETLLGMAQQFFKEAFVFTGQKQNQHMSTRTAERIVRRAAEIAQIKKHVTPHTLRHSFATHSFENGCDIRKIQKILGHVNLTTTTIYIKVAKVKDGSLFSSPIDDLYKPQRANPANQPSVGRLKFHFQSMPRVDGNRASKVTLQIQTPSRPVFLTGIVATEVRPGWVTINIPPLEAWKASISQLSAPQQKRIHDPQFFHLLQREIPQRM